MPLIFYFPFIVWVGMMKVVQDEMRVPQPRHRSRSRQANVMHRASIVRLAAPVAHGDLMPQIRQRDVGTKLRDRIPLAVLPHPPVNAG